MIYTFRTRAKRLKRGDISEPWVRVAQTALGHMGSWEKTSEGRAFWEMVYHLLEQSIYRSPRQRKKQQQQYAPPQFPLPQIHALHADVREQANHIANLGCDLEEQDDG